MRKDLAMNGMRLASAIYALLGLGGALAGLYLFFGVGLQPGEGHEILEVASAVIAIGLHSFWCARDLKKSFPWRYTALIFFALLAIVHWMDFLAGFLPLGSPLLNSLPLLLLLVAEALIHRSPRRGNETTFQQTKD